MADAREWWRASAAGAWGPRARVLLLGLAGVFGWLWWIGIAIETQAGFSGNDRYLVLGTALIAIAGGVGWGWARGRAIAWLLAAAGSAPGAERDAGRGRRVGVAARRSSLIAVFLAGRRGSVGNIDRRLPRTHRALVYQAHLREDLTRPSTRLGGAERILACGTVMTEGFQVPMVA